MANIITKEHAEKIAAKLEAMIEVGAKHDLAKIYHNNRILNADNHVIQALTRDDLEYLLS